MRVLGSTRLAKAGATLAGGAAVGQILLFLTSLAAVRLFTPENMGVFSTLSAISACVVTLATGRYELAIPIPKSDTEGLALARLAISLSAVFSALLALLLLVQQDQSWPSWLKPLVQNFWALPILVMGLALFQIGNQLAVRTESYGAIARRAILFPAVTGILQIAAGILDMGAQGLVLSVVLGQVTAFFALWIPSVATMEPKTVEAHPQTTRALASKHKRFPLFLSISGSLNALSVQMPLLIVAGAYGLHAAGQLGVTMKIVALPIALIGQSIGFVYTGEIARMQRERRGSVRRVFDGATLRLGALGVFMWMALVTLSPTLFPLVLGEQWRQAGEFARILSFGLLAQLVSAPLSQTLTIAGRQFAQFALDLTRALLVGAAGLIAKLGDSTVASAVLAMSAAMFVGYLLVWALNRSAASQIDSLSITTLGT